MTIEVVKPLGQVVTQDSEALPRGMQEAISELRDKLRDEQMVPVVSDDYHQEIFALSSCVYARVSCEVLSSEDAKAVRKGELI